MYKTIHAIRMIYYEHYEFVIVDELCDISFVIQRETGERRISFFQM